MRTKPLPQDDSPPAQPIGIPAGIVRRIGIRFLHEVREALPPTIYFFVSFNFIVLTTNLLSVNPATTRSDRICHSS